MWKLALIAWLIFGILKWIYGIMIDGMEIEEKAAFTINHEIPLRLKVVGGLTLVELITTIIVTIIAIIKL